MAILDNLETTVTFLLVLSVLVVAHEWGHFIIARVFGIRVDDFSIGFGKRLVRLGKRGDTEYNIRMLPLGGFVKIAGMEADEAPLLQAREKIRGAKDDDPDAKELPLIAENSAESEVYNAPDGFNAKPLWQRSLVIFAGPLMSFITGYVILCLMGWTVGLPLGNSLNRIAEVEPGGEGQHIGLQAGDTITAVNGQPISDGEQLVNIIYSSLGRSVTLTVRRGDETLTKVAHPRPMMDDNGKPEQLVLVKATGPLAALGVHPGDVLAGIGSTAITTPTQAVSLLQKQVGKPTDIVVERGTQETPLHGLLPTTPPLSTAKINSQEIGVLDIHPMMATERTGFVASIQRGNGIIVQLFSTLASLIRHGQLHKQVGGVIVMYRQTAIDIKNGFSDVLFFAAQLSISLAIFNLLPIPILDGGHLLNFFIEWIRGGKKMSEEWQARFMMTGLAIIGTLFVWIMAKNTLQLIFHQLPQ